MSNTRRPIIGGNWKMNTTLPAAVDLAGDLVRRLDDVDGAEIVIFPPFPNLEAVGRVIAGSPIQLGAQDVFWEAQGAFTGEVSASMLTAVGCGWVIVGHSERRHLLGETSEIVNRKLAASLHGGLRAILAIGETRAERHAGHTDAVLKEQLHHSLIDIPAESLERIVVAYEPVWAIGTGEVATPAQAWEAHAHVRSVLAGMYGEAAAERIRIQYGGSVSAANCADLLAQPGIDGALVGGASLKADDFSAIVRAAEEKERS